MKLLQRHESTNGKAFETYLLDNYDTSRFNVPRCDVIGLRRISGGEDDPIDRVTVMRPDEALIQARMLVDAVRLVTGEYWISLTQLENDDDNNHEGKLP